MGFEINSRKLFVWSNNVASGAENSQGVTAGRSFVGDREKSPSLPIAASKASLVQLCATITDKGSARSSVRQHLNWEFPGGTAMKQVW
jgi:hypothetical protein